jgi:hypothetical protein
VLEKCDSTKLVGRGPYCTERCTRLKEVPGKRTKFQVRENGQAVSRARNAGAAIKVYSGTTLLGAEYEYE